MTAFFTAAFLFVLGLLAGRPRLWALTHADPRIFFAGAGLFVLLGLLELWRRRLPFQRKYTGSRFTTYLERDARIAALFRGGPAFFVLPGIALAGTIVFYSMRMRLFAPPPEGLGDSLLLLEHVPVYARLFGYLDSFDELLALFIRSKAYLLGADLFGLQIETSYALLSCAAGGVYCVLLLWFLRGRSLFAAGCGLALFLFSPAVQLYAGYVENYTIASLLLTASLFLAGRALENESGDEPEGESNDRSRPTRGRVLLLAGLAALGVLVHGVVAFLGPALIYFAYRAAGGSMRRLVGLAGQAGALALGMLVPVWIYFFFFATNPVDFLESFAYHPALYPPDRWFSADHFGPLLNLPLLAAPGALLLFWLAPLIAGNSPDEGGSGSKSPAGRSSGVIALGEHWLAVVAPRPVHRFFLLASLTFAGHALVWNPLIGFPADWDLFTFFQGPLHCFVFYRFITPDRAGSISARPVVLFGLLFISLATGPFWLARNGQETAASRQFLNGAHANVDRFLKIVRTDDVFQKIRDPHRRKKYVKGLLFVLRSREFLAPRPEPAAKSLLVDLERAWASCQKTMLLPDSEFQEAFPAAWQDLTRVNFKIEAFKTRP